MEFKEIKKILDSYTVDCVDCNAACGYDCASFVAKSIKDDIFNLLYNDRIKVTSFDTIPCKLYFKGVCKELPKNVNNGDLWLLQTYCDAEDIGFYYYNERWYPLPKGE